MTSFTEHNSEAESGVSLTQDEAQSLADLLQSLGQSPRMVRLTSSHPAISTFLARASEAGIRPSDRVLGGFHQVDQYKNTPGESNTYTMYDKMNP